MKTRKSIYIKEFDGAVYHGPNIWIKDELIKDGDRITWTQFSYKGKKIGHYLISGNGGYSGFSASDIFVMELYSKCKEVKSDLMRLELAEYDDTCFEGAVDAGRTKTKEENK